jgi:hypothetical protein
MDKKDKTMNKSMLISRQWLISGNWNAPSAFLQTFKSVYAVDLVDQSSSAGDWSGLIFQRRGGNIWVIPFSQENNFPKGSFILTTNDKPWAVISLDKYDAHAKNQIIESYCNSFYNL